MEEIQLLRTQENFAQDLDTDDYSATGLKTNCILNSLPYYHVVDNVAFDIMHDFLGGILPLELKLVLGQLLGSGCISLETLNSRIQSFNLGYTDKKNHPSPITAYQVAHPGGSSGQKAAQMQCLMLYFPLLIGDLVNEDSEHWELFVLILHMFKLISSPRITKMGTYHLRAKIEEHHSLFLKLFPERNLTPKQHHCLHYPRAIRCLGPMSQYSVMRMEAKHKQLKNWANSSNNYINVSKTLASRHQQAQGFELLMKQNIASHSMEIGSQVVVKASSLMDCEQVCAGLHCPPEQDLVIANTVTISGYMYRANVIVLMSWDGDPVFAIVDHVLIKDSAVQLTVKPWTTLYYHHHYCAYVVQESNHPAQIISPNDLYDHKPLHMVKSYNVRTPEWFIAVRFKLA